MHKVEQESKTERAFALLERFIRLVRPRYYNRLTWLVVGVGVLLAASPWWSDLLPAVAARFGYEIPAPEPQYAWGYAFIVTGLAYHALTHFLATFIENRREENDRQRRLDHDHRKLGELDAVLPFSLLNGYLDALRQDRSFLTGTDGKIGNALGFLSNPSNRFLVESVNSRAGELKAALAELRSWCVRNFVSDSQYFGFGERFELPPALAQSDGPTLDRLIAAAMERYVAFRDLAKDEVFA